MSTEQIVIVVMYLLAAWTLATFLWAEMGASVLWAIVIGIAWPAVGVTVAAAATLHAVHAGSQWLLERIGAE